MKSFSEIVESIDLTLNEAVSPESAHRILSMYGVKPGDNYFEHGDDVTTKVARDGRRLGIKHNASSRASGKSEDRHIFDRLSSLASKHVSESTEGIDEAKSPWKRYEELEDDNRHSENVIHMAKHVGDEDDVKKAKDIFEKHKKIGYLSDELSNDRRSLEKKLWPKFHAAFAPKE